MSYSSFTCPKCGFPSRDPEICDSCGVIFAKLHDRDLDMDLDMDTGDSVPSSQDYYPDVFRPSTPPVVQTIFKALVGVAVLGLLVWAGYRYFSTRAADTDALARMHRDLVEQARDVFLTGIPEERRGDLLKVRMQAKKLSPQIARLRKAGSQEDRARNDILAKANSELQDVLVQPVGQLAAGMERRRDSDPFAIVDQKLEFVETGTSTPLPQGPAATASLDASRAALQRTRDLLAAMRPRQAEGTQPDNAALALAEAKAYLPTQAQQPAVMPRNTPVFEDISSKRVTENTFSAKVLQADRPVLVEFVSTKDQTGKQMSSVIDELDHEYNGRLIMRQVDVTAQPNLAQRCGVTQVPSVVIFVKGQPVQRDSGVLTRNKLKQMIDKSF